MSSIQYDRDILVDTLVHHQRKDSQYCTCGWGVLGMPHSGHIANVYEASVRRKYNPIFYEVTNIHQAVYESMLEEFLEKRFKELNEELKRSTKESNQAYLRRMLDEGKVTVTRIDTGGEDDEGMRIELLVDPE